MINLLLMRRKALMIMNANGHKWKKRCMRLCMHVKDFMIMTKELNKIKNNRLRRMKTRLAIYNLDVKYIAGRKMVVADCLSRDYIVTKSSDDRTMDDVVHSIEMKQIEFSEDKLNRFQKRWPTNKKKVKTGEMSNYWSLRNEIVAGDGLLYFKDKLIVPRELRQLIMSLLHETLDYYSRWLEAVEISDKTTETIISVLKTLFSRFGIPKEFMSDNVPFNSLIFKKFAQEWDSKIITSRTSSPNYPQSNGMAEKSVGIFKSMMRKCKQTG
ncbi:uncharacterized protein LOC126549450 [Aphis gossypii]|uniref:uncharacterized protein LOC126549450 n=1 Tax=Aphis gossypii TaxID=80765 RepID=UPI00215906AF|nr:uncharacterized protein LOC126549450 [Aphis gossypii]